LQLFRINFYFFKIHSLVFTNDSG